jgi:mono/diheme cytochrome c family protein
LGIAASIFHDGVSAKATPTRLEAFVARNARHLAIPANARLTQNPVLDSPEGQREARLHFADHCAICHGNDGSGDTPIGSGLYPKPPDLRKPETQDLSDGELFWIIENGVRFTGMPAFSGNGDHANGANHGNGQDSWKLVHFIRHLPHLTVAERLEMERYNPKGPEDRVEEQEENEFLNDATPKAKPESQTRRRN